MIVVDAGVAVKWYLDEAGSEAAIALLTGPRKLRAPDFVKIEVAAAITRRTRLKQLAATEAETICAEWFTGLKRRFNEPSADW